MSEVDPAAIVQIEGNDENQVAPSSPQLLRKKSSRFSLSSRKSSVNKAEEKSTPSSHRTNTRKSSGNSVTPLRLSLRKSSALSTEIVAVEDEIAVEKPTIVVENDAEEKSDSPPVTPEPTEAMAEEEKEEKEEPKEEEPEVPAPPTPEEIQAALDAQTTYIEDATPTMEFTSHAQLARPSMKSGNQRRRPTNNLPRTFAQMEEEERKRLEEEKKPKLETDQSWDDPLDLLGKKAQGQASNLASEAQNIHAAFAQKAKERKAREEAAAAAAAAAAVAVPPAQNEEVNIDDVGTEPKKPAAALACCIIS